MGLGVTPTTTPVTTSAPKAVVAPRSGTAAGAAAGTVAGISARAAGASAGLLAALPAAAQQVTNNISVASMGPSGNYKGTYIPGSMNCVTNTTSKNKVFTFPAADGTSQPTKIVLPPGGVATNTVPAQLTIYGTPALGTTPFTPITTVTEGIPQNASALAFGTPVVNSAGPVVLPSIFTVNNQ